MLVFPAIKGIWTKLNDSDAPVVTIAPTAPDRRETPVAQPTVNRQGACLSRLIEFASCLPEEERKDLIQKFAADLVMKEIQ